MERLKGKGLIIVVSAPSGAGKKAVLDNWERYERLAKELRQAWPADLSSQDVVDAIRR